MLNVQALGILLRALRDGNARPDTLRAPGAVAGVVRVAPVAADANESVRGDGAARTLPSLHPPSRDGEDRAHPAALRSAQAGAQPLVDARTALPRLPLNAESTPAHELQRTDARGVPRDAEHGDSRIASREPTASVGVASPQRAANVNTASTALALSATGRWLTDVHAQAQGATQAQGTTHARTAAPALIADAASPPAQLATALERAVQTSGLFYEAHLARWLADDLPLAQIAREPQAAWSAPAANDAPAAPAAAAAPAVASLPQDADKLSMVARQLDALESKTIVWTGTTWPGQPATIEIREDEKAPQASRGDETDAATPVWRTRIALTLPSLGIVDATLTLRGQTLELALVAPDTAKGKLADARNELASALATRSLDLVAFSVGGDDGR